ncbi:MAG: hypothetical protein NZM35_03075 [Chitinophagales bacterium]|nr:hypothetical protein [Chitinophagales bacterium]MDW8418468.1 hypothetical protein [Chitinophagales bacterium]
MFSFFCKKDKGQIFWEWFVNNKTQLEKMIDNLGTENNDLTFFRDTTEKLKEFDPALYAEFTYNKETGNYVIVITPNGIRNGIEPTEKIVSCAPVIPRWEVRKYRKPTNDRVEIKFQGISLQYDDFKVLREYDKESHKMHIALLMKEFDPMDERYGHLGFLALDHYVGEYNVMTCIGGIDFASIDDLEPNAETIDLFTLRQEIEKIFYG